MVVSIFMLIGKPINMKMLVFSLIAQSAPLKPIQPHKLVRNRCPGRVMARNRMKFQESLSLFNFQRL